MMLHWAPPPIVRQLAYLCLFAQTEYKCDVATLESEWVTLYTAGEWNFVVYCLNEKVYFYTKTFLKKSETCKLEVEFFAGFFVVSCHCPLLCSVHVYYFLASLCTVCCIVYREGFPLHQGGSMQRTYEITPLLSENRVSHKECVLFGVLHCTGGCSLWFRTNVGWLWMDKSNMRIPVWLPPQCECIL